MKPAPASTSPGYCSAVAVGALLWLAAIVGLRSLGLAPWQVAVFLALVMVRWGWVMVALAETRLTGPMIFTSEAM